MAKELKLGLSLWFVTAFVGMCLGMIHWITAGPIEQAQAREKLSAMKITLGGADTFRRGDIDISEESSVREVFSGYRGNSLVGYNIRISVKGYGGPIQMMVGISKDGRIAGMRILSHSETPGLGARAVEESFSGQFEEKPVSMLAVVKTAPSGGSEIQAMTGATITSRAVTSGVNDAIDFYNSELRGGQQG